MHTSKFPCAFCQTIFTKYPNFHPLLKTWFEALQKKEPDCHISCAGRGQVDQEKAFYAGVSKARWRESAHNYNMAIDVFQDIEGKAYWDVPWYLSVIRANLIPDLYWYGEDRSYTEYPHIEIRNWRSFISEYPPVQ